MSFTNTATRATGARTVGLDVSVHLRELMTVDAFRLSCFSGSGVVSVVHVLQVGNRLQVRGTYTQGIFTLVVNFLSVWNGTHVLRERPHMRVRSSSEAIPAGEKYPISSVRPPGPVPTVGGFVDVVPEANLWINRLRSSFSHKRILTQEVLAPC